MCIYTYMYIYIYAYICRHILVCVWCPQYQLCIGEGALSVIPLVSVAVLCCLFELGLWNAKQQQPVFHVSLLVADSLPDHALLPLILN